VDVAKLASGREDAHWATVSAKAEYRELVHEKGINIALSGIDVKKNWHSSKFIPC